MFMYLFLFSIYKIQEYFNVDCHRVTSATNYLKHSQLGSQIIHIFNYIYTISLDL